LYDTSSGAPMNFWRERSPLMFRLVRWLSMLLFCLAGIGFCLGWFTLSSSPNPDTDSNKVNVDISVDKAKLKSDVKKAREKIKEEVKELAGKAKAQDFKK
jgi:hypothetical protein